MRKKIIAAFLAIVMVMTILPLAAQAKPNLIVNTSSRERLDVRYYNFTYTLRNTGPDDIEDGYFSDAAGFKIGGIWYTHQESWVEHEGYDLPASTNSEEFYWEGDTPSGWKWFTQCTDENNTIDEVNENDNCKTHFWRFY